MLELHELSVTADSGQWSATCGTEDFSEIPKKDMHNLYNQQAKQLLTSHANITACYYECKIQDTCNNRTCSINAINNILKASDKCKENAS